MAAARFYSSVSGSIDLTASIVPSDSAITVSTTTGLPGTVPFTLVLDPGTATEEIVTATNVSGLTITITRGVDGSTATSHAAGVGNVRHMATARDFREPQEHIAASVNVHGIGTTGSVVGTDASQTLSNKTLASPTITGTAAAAAVTASSVAVTTTSTATTGLTVTAMSGATGPALDAFENALLGTTKARVKAAPGSTDIFQVTGNDYGLISGGSFTVTKSGRVSVVGSNGLGEPSTPMLTLKNADATTAPTTLSIQNSAGTEVAKVDGSGNLTAAAGTFSAAVSATNLSANMPAASTTKANKRLHWGTASGTTDASGYATITHGAGFTPTAVVAQPDEGIQWAVDSITATTFRLRLLTSAGAVNAAHGFNISFFCGE